MKLEVRIALVMGSSRANSFAIAAPIPAEGALVAVHGRDQQAIDRS